MQTLKPTSLSFSSITEKEQEVDLLQSAEEEDSLAFVARSEGWTKIVDYMGDMEAELDQMVADSIASGLSLEEIGKRTVVKELAKDAIRRIKVKVEDARTASDRRRS